MKDCTSYGGAGLGYALVRGIQVASRVFSLARSFIRGRSPVLVRSCGCYWLAWCSLVARSTRTARSPPHRRTTYKYHDIGQRVDWPGRLLPSFKARFGSFVCSCLVYDLLTVHARSLLQKSSWSQRFIGRVILWLRPPC